MRITIQEAEAYRDYLGTNPIPYDFDDFWRMRIIDADLLPLSYELIPANVPNYDTCHFYDLWFYGMGGARLHAKYVFPIRRDSVPLVLQFHGYPGASRSWLELASFAGIGCAVLAFDCPGQGGLGDDLGGFLGTTVSGHIIAGLDGPPENMYYVKLYQNIHILCRIIRKLDGIDQRRIYINGASQGGGLGVACAALNPELPSKAAILYPFLSDYQKVWELGADTIAYEGIRYYSRWFDPAGERLEEVFTKLGYIDTHNFAHLVQCEVLFGTCLSDSICPPCTQFAVYNNLSCKKHHILFPDYEHEETQSFDDMIISFFCEEEVYL